MRQASVKGLKRATLTTAVSLAALVWGAFPETAAAQPQWDSPNRCRVLLTVDPRGVSPRSHSPTAPLRIDFNQLVRQAGPGTFDENTIEVIAYEPSGTPYVYDASRTGYERYLLPWRIDKYYRMDGVDLVFVMPDHTHLQYAVYFDTVDSGLGRPRTLSGSRRRRRRVPPGIRPAGNRPVQIRRPVRLRRRR